MRTRPGHSGTDEQRGLDNLNFILDLVEVGGDQPKIDLTWRLRNCGHGARPPFQLLIQTGKTDRERKESVDFSLFPLPLVCLKGKVGTWPARLPLPATTACLFRTCGLGGGYRHNSPFLSNFLLCIKLVRKNQMSLTPFLEEDGHYMHH